MNQHQPQGHCSTPGCCGTNRRDFLKIMGLGAVAAMASGRPAVAGPFEASQVESLIPADKKLSADWVRSLFERGDPQWYHGPDLDTIGMPVGGIGAGHLYLGGDGKLWLWDIFNLPRGTGDANYARPLKPVSPVDQGFALRIAGEDARPLSREGFSDVRFRGEYPIGRVEYRDDAVPVTVSLEAFSPFIPLNAEDSALPATLFHFTLSNTSRRTVRVELAGWLQNVVGQMSGEAMGVARNRVLRRRGATLLECTAASPSVDQAARPPVVFADFDTETYGDWKVEGEAFGKGPARGALGTDQRLSGFQGSGLVNSYPASDQPQGKLTSPSFILERPFISFLIGGGNHPGETCINLVVDGRVARTETGRNTDAMVWRNWNVADLAGKTAHIEIVDHHSGGWGHIDIDQIEFGDRPRAGSGKLEDQPDFGTLGLVLLNPGDGDRAAAGLTEGTGAEGVFEAGRAAEASAPFGRKLRGALSRPLTLQPGRQATVTFALVWHFPNHRMPGVQGGEGRRYAVRFPSAASLVDYLGRNHRSLARQTRLWRDNWYHSTLPYWFLDRTLANASTLSTSTCHWFREGRFYGWEGVGCCAGTCTHVWHYAHAVGRLFPQLERILREQVDYGISFDPKSGLIDHRGEFKAGVAIDGQAGCILRTYREHQMSADDAFLRRLWPKVRLSLEYLIQQDGNGDGILEGGQWNTLDSAWFGPVAWLSSLYLAALRAGEAMATEMGDEAFARKARDIRERGGRELVRRLWNGEYFIHRHDPSHPEAIGSTDGCEIDQVFGQSWAFQVGLGRVLDEEHTRKALRALWKYNFAPDVGPYRGVNKSGRWYAMPGEGGLIMCTWPRGGRISPTQQGNAWTDGYFNECMSGFEYQAAGHMIWEGMVQEGLAVTRAIHDRYDASRRNPWNEVECGDHYARAMASYGVYLAACGYEHHGPKGYLAFAPRLSPEDFRAAFTTCEGWGTFSQKREAGAQRATVQLRWGRLRLRTLGLALPEGAAPGSVKVALDGKTVSASHEVEGDRLRISLASELRLRPGQRLEVAVA